MPILATCDTLAAVLTRADGGETVALRGECPAVTIERVFRSPVTVDVERARVAGLSLQGANIVWRGGTLSAPDGMDGKGPNGYAVHVSDRDIRIMNATVTNAKKGMVIDRASNVTVERVAFWRLQEDGIIASRTKGLTVTYSAFSKTLPSASRCFSPTGVVATGVPRRACAGRWIDGSHPDAIQMRDGVTDVRIAFNAVSGPAQASRRWTPLATRRSPAS